MEGEFFAASGPAIVGPTMREISAGVAECVRQNGGLALAEMALRDALPASFLALLKLTAEVEAALSVEAATAASHTRLPVSPIQPRIGVQ